MRRGAQEPGRMQSRRGSIATSPMDPFGVVNVVVPELVLASCSARTSTLTRERWPAGGWGYGVGAPEFSSSASCAGASTPLPVGSMPLVTITTAMDMPRKPCVGTIALSTKSEPTHDLRRGRRDGDVGTCGVAGTGGRGGPGTMLSGRPRAPLARTVVTLTVGHSHITGLAVDMHATPVIVSLLWSYVTHFTLGVLPTLLRTCGLPRGDGPMMADGRRPSHIISQELRCHRIARRAAELRLGMMLAALAPAPTVHLPSHGMFVPAPSLFAHSTHRTIGRLGND